MSFVVQSQPEYQLAHHKIYVHKNPIRKMSQIPDITKLAIIIIIYIIVDCAEEKPSDQCTYIVLLYT